MSSDANTVSSGTKYILPSDEAERERLNMQHEVLKSLYKSLLPPGYTPKEDDEILDSGTGTGIWPLDVASSSPATVRFTGIDITTKLFPSEHPPNITFIQQSVLDLPASWSSRFALVHQRLLTGAFGLAEWKAALLSFFRVLRPGGWVRLEEFSPRFVPPLDEVNTPKSFRTMALMVQLVRKRDLLISSLSQLPGLLKEAGFVEVEMKDFVLPMGPGDAHERARRDIATVFRRLAPALVAITNISAQEANELIDGFEDEMANHDVGMIWHTFTARKPPTS